MLRRRLAGFLPGVTLIPQVLRTLAMARVLGKKERAINQGFAALLSNLLQIREIHLDKWAIYGNFAAPC